MSTEQTDKNKTLAKQPLNWLVIALLCLSVLAVGARLFFYGSSQLAGGDQLWRLSMDISVRAEAQTTAIQIHPPIETVRLRIIQRTLQHPGFRIRNWSEDKLERRSILAFASRSGQQSLHAEFFVQQLAGSPPATEIKRSLISNAQREKFLQDTTNLQLSHPLLTETLKTLNQQQPDRALLVDEIFKFLQLFATRNQKDELNVISTLSSRQASDLDRAMVMVALCRAAGFPARLVSGLILKDDIDPRPRYWVEVYQDEKWLAYDISAGYRGSVPTNYLPIRRDGADIVQVLNGELLQMSFDLDREFDHPYLHQQQGTSLLSIFDLGRLPLDVRNQLAALMLLPLGALITAICRHLAGLRSYGVFTPTLLALAMVYTDILTTAIIFFVVCSLAVAGRSLFPASITRTPRLAIIFTLVAMILSFSASVMDYFDLRQGGQIILLPIIILTSLVDRLYRTIEDKGLTIAMHRLIWTLLITLLCVPVMQFESLGLLLVQYPESHLSTLGLFLLISTYKGKQLVNLPIIKWLAEPEGVKRRKSEKLESSD